MRIFVSHSTAKDNDAGKQRLLELKAALETDAGAASGHEVLLDFERLEPGFQWRKALDEWMASCHSAVLLLDPVAVKSPWVLKEATILAHRAASDKDFLLFPALLDGVKRDDLGEGPFSKLYLDALQRLSKTDAAGMAAQVKAQLAKLGSVPTTPLDKLARALANQLRAGDPGELESICKTLTGKPVQWTAQESRAERCAREIARAVVRGERGDYASLRELIRSLRIAGLTKEALTSALHYSAPLWVAGPAAAPLADLAHRNCGAGEAGPAGSPSICWATALNGEYVPNFTADMYVRRAFLPRRETIRTIEGGASDALAEELIGRIREEVRNREGLRTAKADAVDRFLSERKTPYFIVLPPPMPDEATLLALQQRYPRITFIVHTGNELPPEGGWPQRVLPLMPAVDLQAELAAFEDFNGALDDIDNG